MASIGIDLGTTYSCVGCFKDGRVEIIPNDLGERTTPSYVTFNTETGEIYYGRSAKSEAESFPTTTIYDVKRFIGKKSISPDEIAKYPYKISVTDTGPVIHVNDRTYKPEEISAMLLREFKNMAERFIGSSVTKAVITVPAYFTDSERQATSDASKIAGFETVRIVNEPTAAAVAYGLDKKCDEGQTVMVYDIGGGTLDVSILRQDGHVFTVIATAGDTHLGGEDFDNCIVNAAMQAFSNKNNFDINDVMGTDPRNIVLLKREAERAKRDLSSVTSAKIEIRNFYSNRTLTYQLTRPRLMSECAELFKRAMIPVQTALKDANITIDKIDEVVLVGGSSRIPRIRELIEGLMGSKKPNLTINPDEAVAYGATVLATSIHDGNYGELLLIDVVPRSLGVEIENGRMDILIPKQSTIPTSSVRVYSNAQDGQTGVVIKVFEGEDTYTVNNNKLGEFRIKIQPAKRAQACVEVTFTISEGGILSVTATDQKTHETSSIVVSNGRMCESEIIKKRDEQKEEDSKQQTLKYKSEKLIELETLIEETDDIDKQESIKSLISILKEDPLMSVEEFDLYILRHKEAEGV